MRIKNTERLFFLLLLAWFVLNLAQAIFTEIHADEAYYAIWGKNLDWGYFDHPPAVAVLTYLGSLFFEGNLGVRFFTIVLHLFSVSLLWFSIDEKYRKTNSSVYLFFILVASLTMFSVYAFTTTPDVPLIFFASLFLFGYKKFLDKNEWRQVPLLVIAMAGMLYSKYHGALFIGLAVLSHWKLLLNIKFWVAGILALLLLIPHFWWQYIHDFSSLKFHLVMRSLGFNIKYVLEFIPGQLGVFNPFVLGGVGFVLWKTKAKNQFEKTLYFIIIGVVSFFFISTYKGRAEAHWTTIASLPMLILLVIRATEIEKVRKYIQKYVAFSLVLIFIARAILLTDYSKKFGYQNLEQEYKAIENIAKDAPVVFNSSFQNPALYEFYTGKIAMTIGSMETRQTQYDLWQRERKFADKEVFLVLGKDAEFPPFKKYEVGERFTGFVVETLQIPNRLKINFTLNKTDFKRGEWVELPVEIENPTNHQVDFNHPNFPIVLKVVFFVLKRDYALENVETDFNKKKINPSEKIKGKIKFKIPENLKAQEYKFSVITHYPLGHTQNAHFESIDIK